MEKRISNLTKLHLMVVSIPLEKKEIIGDILHNYDVTFYTSCLAKGTSSDVSANREMMFCLIKEDKIKDAMFHLQDKMDTFKSKVSMVYTIPLDNIIGVSNYIALTNGGMK